ncbi:MAG: sugar kinase [Devosia sp.]|jgi:sugar/nucleoside kinase (ribokinase family)|uniref:carbohydrate kinase family protein n=1 Tax=unclassified Devosia TaxID=196773 RepID=UPI0019FD088E|nr:MULTISPECIES: sugar kinase [unclassified Devosia]MBF0679037.1 sugar kinase [Devosia sp.]WEJ33651.1 sugar kinase [Devosia sp. SD17-2]
MKTRVLVVGDVMTDIIVKPEGPIVMGSDRRAQIRTRPGGSGANQAVWLAAAGADVVFAARVGAADVEGYGTHFRDLGVVPALASDGEMPSGVLVTIVSPDGERSFLTDRGANLNLSPDDLPASLLDGAGFVLVSGYSLFAPGPRAAVQALFEAARARGIPCAIDPASVGFLEEVGASNFRDWVGPLDWIFANEDEARSLTGEEDLNDQIRALGEQFGQVVIKRGRLGAVLGDRNGISHAQAAPAVDVVDTTGAGDAFAGGFVAALTSGLGPEECLTKGISQGAAAVQTIGGQPT